MKNSRNQSNKQNKQGVSRVPKPEIRDNLDSRKNEEQDLKGSDIRIIKRHEAQSEQFPLALFWSQDIFFYRARPNGISFFI